ncbi:hypothetical protein [Actinomyces mediterranea]|uniref:hypothetical protein n=1 Tax=Actinomyces mediterranea TaxID=1871028 RepID=UPI00101ADEF5|nr:hypothetical protein [Actinomyces mediterranea]
MSKDVDSMKDNPQSSRPEIPAYWLNWSSLWDRQLKRAISEWDTGAFRHLNRQYEALRQAFEAFHVEISPLDAAALQSARAAFLTRHATESRIHSEEDVLLCFILTEEEMKWRRVLLTAADDGVEEASEELHIECSADLATAFLFAAVIDRSLADLLTYGMVAVSETEAPGELLYRMMELVEDTVLSLDIGADPEDGLERAVKEKLLERVSNARIGALLERLESDDTRVHLARDIGVMQMNLNEKPTDLFTQADRIGQYGKVHNLRFVDDHRYLGRALIDLVAQDFRDARWEDVCESAEALVSTGELAPVSESLLIVFSDWAALQCVENPISTSIKSLP